MLSKEVARLARKCCFVRKTRTPRFPERRKVPRQQRARAIQHSPYYRALLGDTRLGQTAYRYAPLAQRRICKVGWYHSEMPGLPPIALDEELHHLAPSRHRPSGLNRKVQQFLLQSALLGS